MPEFIAASKLAQALRCTQAGLLRSKVYSLPVSYLNCQRVFTFAEVDAFVAGCVRNGAAPPTATELLESLRMGENLIITPKEVAGILKCAENTLCHARKVNSQPYLQVGKLIRYVKRDITAEARRRDSRLTGPVVQRILCISLYTLAQFVADGLIEGSQDKQGHYEVDRNHLRQQLLLWLPPWADPDEWINMQLETTEPAVNLRGVGVDPPTVKRRLEEFELPYLKIKRTFWRIPAETARIIRERDVPALETQDIARLFFVTPDQAASWVRGKAFVCHMHAKAAVRCLRPACLCRYIHSNGTVGNRWEWYRRSMGGEEGFCTDTDLVGRFGAAPVIKGLKTRQLQGVRLPQNSGWRFLHQDAAKFAAALNI